MHVLPIKENLILCNNVDNRSKAEMRYYTKIRNFNENRISN